MILLITKYLMNEKYKDFLKTTKAFQNSNGNLKYSFEFNNSTYFPFGGFDEFNNTLIEKIKYIFEDGHNIGIRKNISFLNDVLNNDYDNFLLSIPTTGLNKELIFKPLDVFYNRVNPKIFKTSSSLIYSQWKKIIERYKIEDIYSEKFKEIQKRGCDLLESIQKKTLETKNLIFNISTKRFENNSDFFNLVSQELKNPVFLDSILFFIENNSSPLKFNKELKEFQSILDEMFELILDIQKDPKFQNYGKIILNNMAEDFIDYFSKNEDKQLKTDNKITDLLDNKFLETVSKSIKLSKSQKYEECFYFINCQIVFKDNKGSYIQPKSKKETHEFFNTFSENIISYELRKNPSLSKFIINKFKEEGKIEETLILIEAIKENQEILKNSKYEFKNDKSIEVITDSIYSVVKNFKVEKLANSILSNKYKHLLSPECLPIFNLMFESNFTKSDIQEFVGKKIASCKTKEDFHSYLESIYNSVFNFGVEKLNSDLRHSKNAKIIIKEENLVVLKIDNFDDSKLLGTSNWCISRSLNYFDNYVTNNHQYFIYDFSKKDTDVMSLIGITLYSNGLINAAHNKIDDNIKSSSDISEIVKKIIIAEFNELSDINLHPNYSEFLTILKKEQKKENKLSIG